MRRQDADPLAGRDHGTMTDLEALTASLATLGIECVVFPSGADGAILALPESGRIIGLWPHRRGENLLWVNPEFTGRLQIGAKDSRWVEPGGDRMWLSPEREFFRTGTGEDRLPPPALDPGRYLRIRERSAIRMDNGGEVLAVETGERVSFRLARRIRPLSEGEIAARWGKVYLRHAGYEEEAALEIARGCGVRVSLWNTAQVRAGGVLWLPLRKQWEGSRFAALPPGTSDAEAGCAVLGLRGDKGFRMGIAEAEASPSMYYVEHLDADRSSLLVREFQKEPTEESPAEELLMECRYSAEAGQAELSSFSPSVGGRSRAGRRILWRTFVAGFAGRRTEVESLVGRIVGHE